MLINLGLPLNVDEDLSIQMPIVWEVSCRAGGRQHWKRGTWGHEAQKTLNISLAGLSPLPLRPNRRPRSERASADWLPTCGE